MPGLSSDPEKAKNQLDGLARGRQTLAKRWLEADASREPGHDSQAPSPGTSPGTSRVGSYPEPEDHAPEPKPEQEPGHDEPASDGAGDSDAGGGEPEQRPGFLETLARASW